MYKYTKEQIFLKYEFTAMREEREILALEGILVQERLNKLRLLWLVVQ